MENILSQLPESGRVLVIRLRSLGDCVLTTPALALLKAARPDVKIAVLAEEPFAAVFEGNSDVDELPAPNVAAVARWRPHLCLNLHGGTRSMALTTASGARFRAGFAHFRAAALYNVRIPTAQEILGVDRKVHTAEHLASAVIHLGVPHQEIPRARLAAEKRDPPQAYAVIHPIASASDKTWPAAKFLAVAEHMLKQWQVEPVFIAAAGESLAAFTRFRTIVGAPLARLKNVMASASFFVGNDSGPAHMAAAFGLPTAVVFGASDPLIWGPWKTVSAVLAAPNGIGDVQAPDVIKAIEAMRENHD